jgi:hypothetical protein
MRPFVSGFILFIILAWHTFSYAQILGNTDSMDAVYRDESHCLVAREIRGEKDKPISCFCRDAIIDARYVYQNYLLSGKDRKLNGTFLRLWDQAKQICGKQYDVLEAAETKDWQWNGPQVTREYPPESEINQIQPDSKGFRTVEYKVRLTYRDSAGQVIKVENFTAVEELPANTKK